MSGDDDAARPVTAFVHRGALVIGTDTGEWMTLAAGDQLEPLPATGPVSDAVCDAHGTITVACWEPRLAQLGDDGMWTMLALGAPPTALATTPRGLVIADSSGGLSLLAARVPVQELAAPEPIVSLVEVDGGLVALGASGGVEVTAWPAGDAVLAPVHTGVIGRAHAIFPGVRAGTTLVAGARGLGVLAGQRFVAVTTALTDRIAGVATFGGQDRALVHGDDGTAWIVDPELGVVARVSLGADIAGVSAGADGTVLAWTADGVLHVVSQDGASWRATEGGVVLAVPELDHRGTIAIHWTAGGGVRVTRGHVAWN